jgi:hypothetical protein
MIAIREALQTTDHRAPNPPSERDLEIYAAVRVDGRRQVDVAADFRITQGRVSQIVRRVNHWRVGQGLEAELERRDRKSVDRWLAHLRIEKLYEETMELYRRSCQPRRKERRGKDYRGEWSAESIDHQPGNLQCLKFAGKLLELSRQLDEDPPPPDQSPSSPRSRVDEYEAYRLLVDMREDAIRRGDVREGEISEYVVRRMIGELIGRKEQAPADGDRESGIGARESAEVAQETANEEPVISDISASGGDNEPEPLAASPASASPCAAAAVIAGEEEGANNREIFSPVGGGGSFQRATANEWLGG